MALPKPKTKFVQLVATHKTVYALDEDGRIWSQESPGSEWRWFVAELADEAKTTDKPQ